MSVFTVTILSEGQAMDQAHELLSVRVYKEVNRIPYACVTLVDGGSPLKKFAISDTGFFEPGKALEIKIRYEGKPGSDKTVFKGLVVTHAVEADLEKSVLTVEAKNPACKLTQMRNTRVFLKQTDTKLINKLISGGGLTAGGVPDTKPEHEEIVQYGCTDWDFILSRAESNGLLLLAEDDKISLKEIKLDGSAKQTFEFGISEIYSLEIEADADGQYGEVSSISWDVKDQKMTQPSKAKAVSITPGNLDGKKLAQAFGADTYALTSPAPSAPEELQAWADAEMARSRLGLVRGRLSVPGLHDVAPLDTIEIKGVGKRFDGKALVTGLCHRVSEQGWTTDIQFGLAAGWFVARADAAALPAAGLLPAVSGLHIGIVADFDDDPEKLFRVKLKIPALGDKQEALWARLACPDAGDKRGFFFRPEPGDEVVVGFFNDDPRKPVIIGALFNAKNAVPAPFKLDKDNFTKGLVTKKGTIIGFDDDKTTVFIETPKSLKILLDDDGEKIVMSDKNKNTITMDKDGISLKSGKDLKLEASGNVEIKGSKVDVK
jgi:Rhs element Vgr protein